MGINVALVGYTLAPDASMDDMVAEVRHAIDWLTSALPALGGDPSKLVLSGWSAGAQLAAVAMDHPSVRACLAISGIYDLEPMRHCYVNDKLGLDEASAARNSPSRLTTRRRERSKAYRSLFARFPTPTTFPFLETWSVPTDRLSPSCVN
jgi:acetyl esterase/lipase